MKRVLAATQATGSVFRVRFFAGYNGETWLQTLFSSHTGGTWTLQVSHDNVAWVDSDVTHTAVGVKAWSASPAWYYRFAGGTIGGAAVVATEAEGLIEVVA